MRLFALFAISSLVYAAPTVEKRAIPRPDPARAAEVKDVFQASWRGYYEHAFPHDSLRPISNTSADDRNGWSVTSVDSLSTAIIMGDAKIVNQILKYIPEIDFTTTKQANEGISVFESTIRYLGGLVSSYDLLKGPMKNLVSKPSEVDALLKQAQSLADSLSIAFNTTSGVPDGVVYLNPEPRISGADRNSIAGFGTLVLEWTRLSDLTGNITYAALAQKGQAYLLDPTGIPEPFPGLVGHEVGTEDGKFLDSNGGWGGGTDSFYEYLIKMYLYDPEAFAEYRDRWVLAADSTIEFLASHPTTRKDLTFLSGYSGNRTYSSSGHLASFAGGNFILGGILLKEEKYLKFGLELSESYYQTYHQTASGVGPEGFRWVASEKEPTQNSINGFPPEPQSDFYDKAGFWATSPGYVLRPETVESLYYAYRATGDRKYQDMAWEGFQSISKVCRVGSGFSGIQDVTKADGGSYNNFMTSFWLAETLKYLYLIFAPESEVQLQANGVNGFVYNTEAHPVRVRERLVRIGVQG
ncbi:Mannosyl-oligosaccharide alpha-1,2-mannosidase 1B [Neonectria magnoliae]|uniref:alpha-1,2-Mannosidase n=1 Tax=Neonectria magnoliae TaxID=2732573 RepID=A0ABR1HQ00_9HYPO